MNKGKQKGITLIALIITIIVILILVAVTVSTVANSGLFDHAKDATNKWATEQDREANIGDDVDRLIDEYVGDYYVGNIGNVSSGWIGLIEKETNEPIIFEKAYIKYNGKTIDITSEIHIAEGKNYNYLYGEDIAYFLAVKGIISSYWSMENTSQIIVLIKDGSSYEGIVNMGGDWPY